MDISDEMLNTVYQLNDSDVNVSHYEAWYLDDTTPSSLRPVGVLVASWQLLTALLIVLLTILSSSLRAPRAILITIHLVLLLLISGAFVKLPLVYHKQIVNPFSWRPDAVFCRFHAIIVQFVISALPLVVIAVAADAIVWMRHPGFYDSKMASPLGRIVAVLMPWLVAGVVTLGVVLFTMPGGGHLISGRCIPAFNASRIVTFIVLVLLGRFFLPLLGVAVSMVLLVATTRRHLRRQSRATVALSPPGDEYSRQSLLHACVSVSLMCGLYVCMVGPHYVQVLFLRIPGIARGNYQHLANVGYIAVFIHEAFWNLLPILWVTLQLDALLFLRRCSCCFPSSREGQTSQQEGVEGTELEALTTANHITNTQKDQDSDALT